MHEHVHHHTTENTNQTDASCGRGASSPFAWLAEGPGDDRGTGDEAGAAAAAAAGLAADPPTAATNARSAAHAAAIMALA